MIIPSHYMSQFLYENHLLKICLYFLNLIYSIVSLGNTLLIRLSGRLVISLLLSRTLLWLLVTMLFLPIQFCLRGSSLWVLLHRIRWILGLSLCNQDKMQLKCYSHRILCQADGMRPSNHHMSAIKSRSIQSKTLSHKQ